VTIPPALEFGLGWSPVTSTATRTSWLAGTIVYVANVVSARPSAAA